MFRQAQHDNEEINMNLIARFLVGILSFLHDIAPRRPINLRLSASRRSTKSRAMVS